MSTLSIRNDGNGVYYLFLAFVFLVCALGGVDTAISWWRRRRAARRTEQVDRTLEMPAIEPEPDEQAAHEKKLLDVYMTGYGNGYMTGHLAAGCPSPAHALQSAVLNGQLVMSDPVPRQICADVALAAYEGRPDPHPGVDSVPLGTWDRVQGGDR